MLRAKREEVAGYVERMGQMRNECKILVENPEGRDHWVDLGVDGRLILEWTLGKFSGKVHIFWLRIGAGDVLL